MTSPEESWLGCMIGPFGWRHLAAATKKLKSYFRGGAVLEEKACRRIAATVSQDKQEMAHVRSGEQVPRRFHWPHDHQASGGVADRRFRHGHLRADPLGAHL